MAEIFISYKSERRKAAEHLAAVLAHYGYSVWFDYELIKGSDFGPQIDRQIREAKALVVLWCTLSVGSQWVAEEVDLAHSLGILIPVKIEPCEPRVGFRLQDYIDMSSWDGAPRSHELDPLIDALEQRIGRPASLSPITGGSTTSAAMFWSGARMSGTTATMARRVMVLLGCKVEMSVAVWSAAVLGTSRRGASARPSASVHRRGPELQLGFPSRQDVYLVILLAFTAGVLGRSHGRDKIVVARIRGKTRRTGAAVAAVGQFLAMPGFVIPGHAPERLSKDA